MSLQVNDKEITTDTNFINSFTTPDSKFESNIDNNNNEQKLPSFTKVEDYLNKLIPEISTLDGKEKDHGNTKMDFSLVNSLNSKNNNSLSNGIMNNTSTKNGFESITFKESNDKNSLETTHDNIENQSDDKNNVIGNINENLKLSGKEENDRILSEPDAQIINECLLMNGKASNSTENCIKNQINMDYLLNKSKSISDKSKDNPSEHEMIISPIMNSPLKTSDTNKKGNIFSDSLNLDENYIQPPSKNKGFSSNHETDNIMNNIDNNIFEDLSPFDFLQYHDSSQNILPNSKNNTNNINNGSQIFNFNHNPNGAMTQYPLGELNQEFNSIPQKKLPNELNFTSSLLNFNPLLNDDLSNNNNNYNNNNNARFIHLPYNDGAPGSNLNSELVIPNNLTLTPITNMSFSGLNNSNLSNNKCILNNFSTTNNNSSNSGNINQNNFIYPLGLKTNSNPILLSNPLPWNNANPIIQKNNDKNLIFGQVPDTNTMNGQLSYLLNNNNSN